MRGRPALPCPHLAPSRPDNDDCDSSRLAAVDCTVIESFNRTLCAHLSVFFRNVFSLGLAVSAFITVDTLTKRVFSVGNEILYTK